MDAELRPLRERAHRNLRAALRAVAERLFEAGLLRGSAADAADTLYAVASENTYLRMTEGAGLAPDRYADWLVFEHPQLAGRIAYDSRFELLTSRQLRSIVEFRNRVNGWRSTIGGYSVLVLDKVEDHQPIKALLRAGEARVLARRGPIVVLQLR